MTKHLVFVYGTLMSPYWNHRRISISEDSRFIGEAVTEDKYYFVSAGIPYMVNKGCLVTNHNKEETLKGRVVGELWEVSDEDGTLQSLDRLEGHPRMYRRESLTVLDEQAGVSLECEGYFYQHAVEAQPPDKHGFHRFSR